MLTACEVKEEVTYDADTLEEIVSRFVDRGITRDTFTPHTRIQTWYGTILVTPDYDCRIIFLDPTGLGGDHKCTYLFLDVNTGKWETIESMGCIPIAYEGQAIDYEFTQPLPHDLHSLTKSVFSDSIHPIEHIMQQSASMQNASNIWETLHSARSQYLRSMFLKVISNG